MAEKQQISVMLTVATREALRRASDARKCSQSALVDTAVAAFLTPQGDAPQLDTILHTLTTLHEAMERMATILEALVQSQQDQRPVDGPVPIATYDQLYGPIEAIAPAQQEEEQPPTTPMPPPSRRQGVLRRLLFREEVP
jgi:hypothetical protein